jgi:hypothetical protein
MEKVRICDTLIHRINVACVSKVPAANSPEIDEWIPTQLLQIPGITGPVPILELLLYEKPDTLLDFLVLLHHSHKGLICQEGVSHEQLRVSFYLEDFSNFLMDILESHFRRYCCETCNLRRKVPVILELSYFDLHQINF